MEQQTNKPNEKKWYFKWWAWCLYAVTIVVLVNGASDMPDHPVSGTTGDTKAAVMPEPAIIVSAVTLATEYKDNQVAADIKYKDKVVEISGTIDTIGKDISEAAYVSFEGKQNDALHRVQCYVSKANQASIATLAKGQKLTMRGRVDGGTFNVIVKNCEVIPTL